MYSDTFNISHINHSLFAIHWKKYANFFFKASGCKQFILAAFFLKVELVN